MLKAPARRVSSLVTQGFSDSARTGIKCLHTSLQPMEQATIRFHLHPEAHVVTLSQTLPINSRATRGMKRWLTGLELLLHKDEDLSSDPSTHLKPRHGHTGACTKALSGVRMRGHRHGLAGHQPTSSRFSGKACL